MGCRLDADQIDWQLDEHFLDLPGGDVLLHGGGYNKITDGLVAELANLGLGIQTGVRVEQIIYDADGVVIHTNQDTYRADYVVITVPLGVLKAEQIQFNPPLPEEKRLAIKRIGFGVAEKLVLLFDKFYWPKTVEQFLYLTEDGRQFFFKLE